MKRSRANFPELGGNEGEQWESNTGGLKVSHVRLKETRMSWSGDSLPQTRFQCNAMFVNRSAWWNLMAVETTLENQVPTKSMKQGSSCGWPYRTRPYSVPSYQKRDGSMKKTQRKRNGTENAVLYGRFRFLTHETGFSRNEWFFDTVFWETLFWFLCNAGLIPIGRWAE